jgi:hypothetical protein
VGKIFFIPFSIAGGLLAGLIGKKAFDLAWGVVDEREPPEPEHREVEWWKLLVALALQGAIFRIARGVAERGSRAVYWRLTGSWPGEEEPEPA